MNRTHFEGSYHNIYDIAFTDKSDIVTPAKHILKILKNYRERYGQYPKTKRTAKKRGWPGKRGYYTANISIEYSSEDTIGDASTPLMFLDEFEERVEALLSDLFLQIDFGKAHTAIADAELEAVYLNIVYRYL